MFAERCISAALGPMNRRYLATAPTDAGTLPGPEPGKHYVLYAHVPFCERLCVYCSFNRFLYREDRARAYFRDLRAEMRMVADLGYDFDSLYVGGGTPTILVDELAETIDLAHELFTISEVSAESSPNHLGPEVVEALADRVQRLSVGVQSFDDRLLRQMDRYTKYGSGEDVFEKVASVAGAFHSLNVDMIFNFPSQTEEILLRDIDTLKATGTNQTTFYPLMASPATQGRDGQDGRQSRLRARAPLLQHHHAAAGARFRAGERLDVLSRPQRDDRRVHRRLRRVRGHRVRSVVVPARSRLGEHLLALRLCRPDRRGPHGACRARASRTGARPACATAS